jgi:hypothetical protein
MFDLVPGKLLAVSRRIKYDGEIMATRVAEPTLYFVK